ncbi:cytochrome b-c1 complex subunit 7-like [Anthonomus grandis grandis]|uniref:cytochrome b-c1 complex subunit 7-like n=1 Tax=Anthonomus grandis grandis TaxID=2921223 RepID=UPI00216634F6|nr:cytochrome b-c1 complex subunit 7-like [Anthonomus grandis grandis]
MSIQRRFMSSWKEWAYKLSGFNKYGLWRDDLLNETMDVDVAQALKRLPPNVLEERNFRILRAVQLSIRKEVLPKESWTKLEEDKLYLTPMVEQCAKERKEQEEWNRDN